MVQKLIRQIAKVTIQTNQLENGIYIAKVKLANGHESSSKL
jgi:hypothetical protein